MPMHDRTDVITRKRELIVSRTEFQYRGNQGRSKAVNVNETVYGVKLTFPTRLDANFTWKANRYLSLTFGVIPGNMLLDKQSGARLPAQIL